MTTPIQPRSRHNVIECGATGRDGARPPGKERTVWITPVIGRASVKGPAEEGTRADGGALGLSAETREVFLSGTSRGASAFSDVPPHGSSLKRRRRRRSYVRALAVERRPPRFGGSRCCGVGPNQFGHEDVSVRPARERKRTPYGARRHETSSLTQLDGHGRGPDSPSTPPRARLRAVDLTPTQRQICQWRLGPRSLASALT